MGPFGNIWRAGRQWNAAEWNRSPYDGTHYLTMGNNYAAAQTVSQTVTFPSNMIAATLNFAFYIASANPLGDDSLSVNLVTSGGTLGLNTATSQTTSSGWSYTTNRFIPYLGRECDFRAYAGMTASLDFCCAAYRSNH